MIPEVFAPSAANIVKEIFSQYLKTETLKGVEFINNETIQFGWSWLLVKKDNASFEINAPTPGVMPMRFVPDCSESLNLTARQRYICDSFNQGIESCNARQSAIVVKDLASCNSIFMNRIDFESGGTSGWFIGARDSKADSQNANDLELMSLWEISCLHPKTLDFFFLPVNWQVVFAERPCVLNDFEPEEFLEDSYFSIKYMS
jgi:hypothetical protein